VEPLPPDQLLLCDGPLDGPLSPLHNVQCTCGPAVVELEGDQEMHRSKHVLRYMCIGMVRGLRISYVGRTLQTSC